MQEHTVLRLVTKLLIAPIMIFALYVQFHGDYSAGGGFQAGVIFASAIILYTMIFGLSAARHAVPPTLLRITAGLGVLLYAGTGVASLLVGAPFLDYNALAHDPIHGQHIGLMLVEFGVGMTVFATITSIFYVFAGRGRERRANDDDGGDADDDDRGDRR